MFFGIKENLTKQNILSAKIGNRTTILEEHLQCTKMHQKFFYEFSFFLLELVFHIGMKKNLTKEQYFKRENPEKITRKFRLENCIKEDNFEQEKCEKQQKEISNLSNMLEEHLPLW